MRCSTINLKGPWIVSKAVIPAMIEARQRDRQ